MEQKIDYTGGGKRRRKDAPAEGKKGRQETRHRRKSTRQDETQKKMQCEKIRRTAKASSDVERETHRKE